MSLVRSYWEVVQSEAIFAVRLSWGNWAISASRQRFTSVGLFGPLLCRRGICDNHSTPKSKDGLPRDELKNGHSCGWASPQRKNFADKNPEAVSRARKPMGKKKPINLRSKRPDTEWETGPTQKS